MPAAPITVGPGCDQARFVTPLPDRLGVTDPWGDVLLTLTRGLAGRHDEHVETAQTFRMSRIGDQALIRGTDVSALKAAYSISHMLAITYLPGDWAVLPTDHPAPGSRRIPGTKWFLPQAQIRAAQPCDARVVRRTIDGAVRNDSLPPGARVLGGLVNSRKLRDGFGMQGGYYEYSNEEYIHIEADEEGAAVLWSAAVNAKDAATVVEALMGHPDEDLHGFVVSVGGEGADETSADVLDAARRNPADFHLISVGYDDCMITWRRAQVKMKKGQVKHIEMSYSADRVDPKRLITLIGRSATPSVRAALAKGATDLIESLTDPARGSRSAR